MMTGTIILIVLGIMALIGLGANAQRDFNIPSLGIVVTFAIVIGLNLIPAITLGNFVFSIGTAVFFLSVFLLWLLKGKASNKVLCLLLAIFMAGAVYGATRLSLLFNNRLWGGVNIFYALMVGLLTFLLARNAKYGFISSVLAIMVATLLTQIGTTVNLNAAFDNAIIAGATSVVLYSLVIKFIPSRPSRMSYYFEIGRMED